MVLIDSHSTNHVVTARTQIIVSSHVKLSRLSQLRTEWSLLRPKGCVGDADAYVKDIRADNVGTEQHVSDVT
jgi:hypothetical protein